MIDHTMENRHRLMIQLLARAANLDKQIENFECEREKMKKQHKKTRYERDCHMRNAYKDIRNNATAPLNHTTRRHKGQQGEDVVDYITDPTQVDEEVRRRWAEVYKGNVDAPSAQVEAFCTKYAEYICHAEETKIEAIKGQRSMETLSFWKT